MKRLPKINLKELEKAKEENFRERLEFIDMYVDWMKRTSDIKWSSGEKSAINRKSIGKT
ncbi:MAG: hypothetical protein QXU32_07380 [Nitrososphaerales archaeon]